jgi:hypothetical protein
VGELDAGLSLSLWGLPEGQKQERQNRLVLPLRIAAGRGAQVALQRGPILRVGNRNSNMNSRNSEYQADISIERKSGHFYLLATPFNIE